MTYVTGDIPVGAYDSTRLANTGIGHGAIDAGGGYTYFNPQTGREFSAVLGFTYNFLNTATQYQNGVDMHFDWGASQFLSKQVMVGLVGYAYKEIADLLNISFETVRTYIRTIYDKLHVHSRTQATLKYFGR